MKNKEKFVPLTEVYKKMYESSWEEFRDDNYGNDDGLSDKQRSGVEPYPLNYGKISPLDWKFQGSDGMQSYRLYRNIRNATVDEESPRFSITTDESKDYLDIPVNQLKYVIQTAIENKLDIDDSIWDLLEYKSKFQSGKMHDKAGMDRSNYYDD